MFFPKFLNVHFVFFTIGISLASAGNKPYWRMSRHEIDRNRQQFYQKKFAAHSAITEDLYFGQVVAMGPFSADQNKHLIYKGKLYNPQSGRSRTVFIKPRNYGDDDGWARQPMEYVAYYLNLKLDLDYVAPVAYRWENHALKNERGEPLFPEAVVIYAVPNARSFKWFRTYQSGSGGEWQWEYPISQITGDPISAEGFKSDARVMSVMMQNKDLHEGNLMVGDHWVTGQKSPVTIDWGASQRYGTSISMTDHPTYGNSEPVYKIRRHTYDHLKRLDFGKMRRDLPNHFISDGELKKMEHIRNGIVSFFDRLMAERGVENVIIEE